MDLKKILMELGNKLVIERKWDPATGISFRRENTHLIKRFTDWVNGQTEVQEVLQELGVEWSMSEKKE
jgi:hypothetical protein